MQYDDPWYDAVASGWGEPAGPKAPVSPARNEAGEVYLAVQRSAAFQEVRSRYLRFVVPAVIGFFVWYVAYVVAATTAPGLMARPVLGAVNVAILAGLGQFLTTFVLTWAYARHARLRRDRAALELRWDTQEMTRGARGGAS
ncbi:membrane protein [Streptomyces spinoverrucosus]|uniref:Membrane protein n=1 Tax=Streptomyces spinoverrucosus TaxID=284043 RepID=A0A4Y3VP21_9ACTN|nr:membrane protein [Streptomyces spinoverrucosus]GHB84005.1 membrane protein [Streptomyces spinoverrucosus]